MRELNPSEIVRVLNHHKVRYVIIGGVAAEIHDLPVPVRVVSVQQWAALKAASGRAKDLEHLDAFFEARHRE
jgi:predicted nucleotidyltransferase